MIGAGINRTEYLRFVSILLLVFVVLDSVLECSYRLSSVSLCGCFCPKLIIQKIMNVMSSGERNHICRHFIGCRKFIRRFWSY